MKTSPWVFAAGLMICGLSAGCTAPFDTGKPPPLVRPPAKPKKAGFDPTASAFDDFGERAPVATSTTVRAGSDLTRQNLSGFDLRGQRLDGMRMKLTKLTRALLTDTSLRSIDGRGAIFVEARARGADFSRANLSGAKAQRADFARASFRDAQLAAANLYGANLSGADLRGASLVDAVLISARLRGARWDAKTVLPFDRAEAGALGMIYEER